MTQIHSNQLSGTVPSVLVMASCFASLFQPPPIENNSYESNSLYQGAYFSNSSKSTFDSWKREYSLSSVKFEQVIKNFYSDLTLNQEGLGSEFERILNDNMWDLYES